MQGARRACAAVTKRVQASFRATRIGSMRMSGLAASNAAIICCAPCAFVAPTPIDPSAPAPDTAAAISGVETPAMGAWMMGASISRRSSSLVDDAIRLSLLRAD